MWDRAFLRRLQKELPSWVEHGWLAPQHQQPILDHLASQAGGVRRAPVALAVLGVLLFGTGVILFFAANWDGMAKLTKLVILFGGMWSAYAAAGVLLSRAEDSMPRFAQVALLLGVILFGANIMLIAQIYHIDAHYPNGVLTWALGALALAYLVRPGQAVAVVGLALVTLWSGMETIDFGRFHLPFLVVWALFLPVICVRTWKFAAAAALLSLIVWGVLTYFRGFGKGELLYLTQVFLLAGLGLFLLGAVMEKVKTLAPFSLTVERYAVIGALLSFYGLTPRGIYFMGSSLSENLALRRGDVASEVWTGATLLAIIVVVGLAVFHQRRIGTEQNLAVMRSGQALLFLITLLLLANLFVPLWPDAVAVVHICFNVLYFAGVVWVIYAGYRAGDPFRVNAGFVFFAVGVLTLYFNTFWTLTNRSFFFMAGGLLLLGGGYLIERQRRRLMRAIGPTMGEGRQR